MWPHWDEEQRDPAKPSNQLLKSWSESKVKIEGQGGADPSSSGQGVPHTPVTQLPGLQSYPVRWPERLLELCEISLGDPGSPSGGHPLLLSMRELGKSPLLWDPLFPWFASQAKRHKCLFRITSFLANRLCKHFRNEFNIRTLITAIYLTSRLKE